MILIVDSVNGYLLRSGVNLPISISQIHKMTLLFLMLIRILVTNKNALILTALFLVTLLIPSVNYMLSESEIPYKDFIIITKILIMPIAYFYFKSVIIRHPIPAHRRLIRLFHISFWIIVINMILGGLGYGFSQYGAEGGTRGFFYSGNEISATMVTIFAILGYWLWNKKRLLFIPFFLLAIGISLLKATKVAFFGSLLLLVFIPLVSEKRNLFALTRLRLVILSLTAISIPFLIDFLWIAVKKIGIYDRVVYFYHQFDFVTFILSSRNLRVEEGMDIYIHQYSWFEMIFGRGLSGFSQFMFERMPEIHTVEIDFFDLLFYFGAFGGIGLIFSFWLKLLVKSFRERNNPEIPYSPIIFLTNLLLIGASLTAGHIMISAMAGIFIGFYNSLLYYRPVQKPDLREQSVGKE